MKIPSKLKVQTQSDNQYDALTPSDSDDEISEPDPFTQDSNKEAQTKTEPTHPNPENLLAGIQSYVSHMLSPKTSPKQEDHTGFVPVKPKHRNRNTAPPKEDAKPNPAKSSSESTSQQPRKKSPYKPPSPPPKDEHEPESS